MNNAVYIARYMDAADCNALYGYVPGDNEKEGGEWTATGTQFQVPYVFKTLFSHEDIVFNDLCETKSVSKGAIYLDKNEDLAEGEHILPNVNFRVCIMTCTLSLICPDCGEVEILEMEDYL